jgi:hypothetical protein
MLIGCYRNTYIRRKGLVRVEGLEHCQEEPVEDRLECTGWECTVRTVFTLFDMG